MKWYYGLILLCSLLVCGLLWQNWTKNQLINQLQTQSQRKAADTLTIEVEKKVTEWKTQKVVAEKIVDKWRTDTITYTNIDTLYLEAQKDIFILDTSIKKCDTALNVCLKLNEAQSELNKSLEKQNKNQKKIGTLKIIGALILGAAAEKALNK
jgi:uncharacterized protein (UPF0264 family)